MSPIMYTQKKKKVLDSDKYSDIRAEVQSSAKKAFKHSAENWAAFPAKKNSIAFTSHQMLNK